MPKKVKMNRPDLALRRTYPGQVTWQVWLKATPVKYTTTVTTGIIATVNAVTSAAVTSFSTRFGSTFNEYRIVRCRWKIRFFSSTNPGVVQFWVDEQSSSVPTLVEARERYTRTLSASSVESRSEIAWTCSDPADLAYQAIAATSIPATLKFYTDNAVFGSSVVATDYFEVSPEFEFQFRGLVGV